jgi:hypothetical protein
VPTEPISGAPLPGPDDNRNLVYKYIADAVGPVARIATGKFTNAGARDAAVGVNPRRGTKTWVDSPGYEMLWTGNRWAPQGPRTRVQRANLTSGGTLPLAGTPNANGFDFKRFDESRPAEPYMITVCLNALVAPNTYPASGGAVSFHIDISRSNVRERFTSVEFTPTIQCQNATVEFDMPDGGDLTVFLNYINLTGGTPGLLGVSRWSMTTRPLGLTY